MSKITNDGGLTRSGTGCFIAAATHMATVGVKVNCCKTGITSRRGCKGSLLNKNSKQK